MSAYDQRWVRSSPEGYRLANGSAVLCHACGARDSCFVRRGADYLMESRGIELSVAVCPEFLPVITFDDDTGLDATFNTFRRGPGWFRRLKIDTRVRFYSKELETFVGSGRVVEAHCAPLSEMLERHASFNHLLRDGNYADADARLQAILVRLYGRNYAKPDVEYSVIYIEPQPVGV